MKRFLALVLVLSICGCARSYRDSTLYRSSGCTKPMVAVLPCINSTQNHSLPWDLAEEFTDKLQNRVVDSSKLYLLRGRGDSETASHLNTPNADVITSAMTKNLGAAEFAIVTELLEQNQEVYSHPQAEKHAYLKEVAGKIHLAMRLRVIDLRGDEPKVILQEVVNQDHDIGRPYLKTDYRRSPWGEESYERTPMGLAHNKLVRELIAHAEGYIGAHRG